MFFEKMDLLESTLKVIENRNVAKESLTLNKQGFEQYEQYINDLKENLQETQLVSSRNTKILEINNFTKNAFNENSKQSKILFGVIYNYVQQIEMNLNAISQNENSLDDLCNENNDRLNRVETNFNNTVRLLEIMKKDVDDKISKQSNEIREEIKIKNAEQTEYEEVWKNIVDQHDEKERILNALKLEIEILQDNIDLEMQQEEALVLEKQETDQKILEEITEDNELNNRMMEAEENVLTTSQKLKDILESRTDTLLKENESKTNLDRLGTECLHFKEQIIEVENEWKEKIENLAQEIELKEKLLTENQNALSACQSRTNELNKEMAEISAKLAAFDDEIQALHRKFADEESQFLENNNLEKMEEQHTNLVKSCDELLSKISENKIEIVKKQQELDALKNTPDPELIELKQKLEALEAIIVKRPELEKETEEIDLNNKKVRQNCELEEQTKTELVAQKAKLEQELEEHEKEIRNLIRQYDNVEKDIRRLEVLKMEKIKLIPTPPQKRSRAPLKSQPAKKRGIIADIESDSSVDGERLSYAEFMAKKRMKDNKRQKK